MEAEHQKENEHLLKAWLALQQMMAKTGCLADKSGTEYLLELSYSL